MGDLILQTEPAEFQYSKQSTKMAFLHQEIRQLQEYINDLENVVKLNKDAMRIAISGPANQATQNKLHKGNNDTISTSASANEGSIVTDKANIISMQQIIDHLHQENISLLNAAQRLRKEREMAESRALISEQICEEAQRHENEVLMEMEEKIYELRKLVQDKEYTIQELEKLKPIPDGGDVAIKYREVISPSEQTLKLLDEIDNLNKMLAKVSKENNKLQAENQELTHKNMSLTTELRKLEFALSLPLGAGRKTHLHKGNLTFEEGAEYPQFHETEQPQVLSPKSNRATEQSKKPAEGSGMKTNPVFRNPLVHEKVLALEGELDTLKKLLSREMINNNLLNDELCKLHRQNVMLINQNDTLIKSNKRYEEKSQKMHYTLEFYRAFYEKYMDMVTKRHNPTKSLSSQADFAKLLNVKKTSETLNSMLNAPIPIIKNPKPLTSVAEETDHQVNISILEEDAEAHKDLLGSLGNLKNNPMSQNKLEPEGEEEHKEPEKYEFTKEACKIYLLNLAKDLYMNSNISKSVFTKQILMNMDTRGTKAPATQMVKLKRSLSNPLDYMTASKQQSGKELGARKPIQKKTQVLKKKEEEGSPMMKNALDLNISVIGKPPGTLQKLDGVERKSAEFEDDHHKHQEISFISNDGLF